MFGKGLRTNTPALSGCGGDGADTHRTPTPPFNEVKTSVESRFFEPPREMKIGSTNLVIVTNLCTF